MEARDLGLLCILLFVLVPALEGRIKGRTFPDFEVKWRNGPPQDYDAFVRECADEARNFVSYENEITRDRRKYGEIMHRRYPSCDRDLQFSEAAEIKYRILDTIYSTCKRGSTRLEDVCTTERMAIIDKESGCDALAHQYHCSHNNEKSPFRTADGSCNNLKKSDWGATLTPFSRFLPPLYSDGFNAPQGPEPGMKFNGYPRPSAREVSNVRLASKPQTPVDLEQTTFVMIWGQFIDHDITLTLPASSSQSYHTGKFCNATCSFSPPCFAIPVNHHDPTKHEIGCLPMTRDSPACFSDEQSKYPGVYQRENVNTITSYIDASMVYGSDTERADKLKDKRTGELILGKPSRSHGGKPLLPLDIPGVEMDCRSRERGCFSTGDFRGNENVYLTALQTVWAREHNRIVRQFRKMNPHWDGKRRYYEARKIVGAMIQKITYDGYLPLIIGRKGMDMLGGYEGYKAKVKASVSNEFATAAYRFGHGTIGNEIRSVTKYGYYPDTIPFYRGMFNPKLILKKGPDSFIRGMVFYGTKNYDPRNPMARSMREELHMGQNNIGHDLGALNVQRGRSHGLRPYIQYVKACGLGAIHSWDDLKHLIKDPVALRELKELYKHPGNIDLYAGGMSEENAHDARVGPTFRCIIVDTLRRLRDGDRYWYENHQFSKEQLRELGKTNPEKVFCNNGDNIKSIPRDTWLVQSRTNTIVPCHTIPSINLSAWKDRAEKPTKHHHNHWHHRDQHHHDDHHNHRHHYQQKSGGRGKSKVPTHQNEYLI